jgi:hypothetical protein
MTDNTDQCRVDECDGAGFVVVNTDDEMLCMDHYNEAFDISYLNEPEGADQ